MDIIPEDRRTPTKYLINPNPMSWTLTAASALLGVLLLVAPANWFGPSWHCFDILLNKPWLLGTTFLVLAWHQALFLVMRARLNILSWLFLAGGMVFITMGALIVASGLTCHTGLMEAPFMLYVGGHKIAHSAALMEASRRFSKRERTDQDSAA